MPRALAGVLAVLVLAAGCQTGVDVAREDYASLCAGCHGSSGRGDGPLAANWPMAVPDLTTLSARNQGRFPTGYVISTIDGSTRVEAHGAMPIFWGEIGGELVQIETADGDVETVPRRLVGLAEHVERLQQ